MINLLPDDTKRDIRAARMNVVLLRYNMLTIAAIGLLLVICLFFYVILGVNQSSSVSKTTDNSAKAKSFDSVRKEAEEYSSNLSIANKILNNGVNYTNIIFAITELLPDGVVLDSINLNASDFGRQTTFAAHAKTKEKALELKENFQKSSVFSNVYFENVTDSSAEQQPVPYPISVTVSAKLEKVEQK